MRLFGQGGILPVTGRCEPSSTFMTRVMSAAISAVALPLAHCCLRHFGTALIFGLACRDALEVLRMAPRA